MELWQHTHNIDIEYFGFRVASAGHENSSSFNADCSRYRHDYQIIYLHKGTGKVNIYGTWYPLRSGSLLFYKPMEYQKYRFPQEEDRELYWLYFDSISETEISERFQIPDSILFEVLDSTDIELIFQQIMTELNNQYQGKELMLSLYTGQLLLLLSRHAVTCPLSEKTSVTDHLNAVREIQHDIEVNYMSFVKVQEYAARCDLSTTQFIKLFRRYTGMTPIAYRQKIRLKNAAYLLRTTDKTIQDIATCVGFQDGLYLSKVFQKNMGISPSAYRKQYPIS